MPGFANGVMFADNVQFNGADMPASVTLNGQLLIGSAVAPNIRVGTLTAGTGITITNGPGTISIALTGGSTGAVEHLTAGSGGQLNPDVNNNFNLLGTANQIATAGSGSTITYSLIGPYTPATYTLNGVLFGNGTSSIGVTSQGAANTVLLGNGGVPTFGSVPNAALANSSITLSNGNNITVTGSPVSLGGTASFNLTGTTTHAVQIGNAGGSLTSLAIGTTGQVLTGVTGADPVWASPATSGTVTSVSVASANGFAGTVATATTTPAITISTTVTGVLSGNGTAISGSAVTQYDVLVGGATNAISSVGPGTAGQILQSGGNAANPAYSTTTYPATNAINTLLYASSANVMAALATANNGVLITSASGVPSWLGAGTTGQVLTATTGSPATWSSPSASSITLTGDTGGGLTGSSFTFTAKPSAGSSTSFSGSGTTLTLNTTDSGDNTIIGLSAGNSTLSGTANCGLGFATLNALTTGSNNCSMGYAALDHCTTGGYNLALGLQSLQSLVSGSNNLSLGNSGFNYTTSESSNILLNNGGTVGESNTLRIGSGTGTGSAQLTKAFIQGITGNTVSNAELVTINSSTGQLGVTAISVFSSINIQVITSTGLYTPTSGMIYAQVECIGGGGGGGGLAAITASHVGASGGGAGGNYSRTIVSAATVGASQTVTIGSSGTGGTAGNNNGSGGGQTTFGAICSANGGGGGAGGGSTVGGISAAGGLPGTNTGGTLNISGSAGGTSSGGQTATATTAYGGYGGGTSITPLNSGPGVNGTASLAAINGLANSGQGGTGSAACSTASAAAGGNGGSGICIITEYI